MKIGLVMLAAGYSRRFGGNKLLYSMNGTPLYKNAIEKIKKIKEAYETPFSEIEIFPVTVTQYEEVFEAAEKEGFLALYNEAPERGISSSLQIGLLAVQNTDACLFMVADQPWLKAETVVELIQCFVDGKAGIACIACDGKTGNPCLFHRTYYEELMSLRGDTGGKKIIRAHEEDVFVLEIKNAQELVDIDEPL